MGGSGAGGVTVLGIYVADLAFFAARLPVMGETVMGSDFKTGPGGKGSNQAVAAARAGAAVQFISKIGDDDLGTRVRQMYADEGIGQSGVATSPDQPTGAAFIFMEETTGNNAIIVVPGAAGDLTVAEIEKNAGAISGATVFMTQLETPVAGGMRGLEIARAAGVTTILNPAPAADLPPEIYPLIDYFTPNETEAALLTGQPVATIDEARAAAIEFRQRGVGVAIITLGGEGVVYADAQGTIHIPAFDAAPVVDTTGAGDAFNGGLAAALAAGQEGRVAARFGGATGALSVTRPGTAPSMPQRAEIETLLNRCRH
ncbi:MAG: ribokinase [Hyphomicrobiales bacterium]